MKQGRNLWGWLGRILFSMSLLVVGMEGVFRLVPRVIPAKALIYFEPELRSRLAQGRFPTRADTVLLQRDDGGRAIRLFKPYAVKPYDADTAGSIRGVATDEIGFGNSPGLYSQQDTFDIVAIGDSFTWPSAVEPTNAWTARLAQAVDCTAYNLGRGGTGPYEYLQIFKRFGLPKSPRIVVMNLYEGNDILNIAEHMAYRTGKVPNSESEGNEGKTSWLWRHSHAWNVLAGSVIYLRHNFQEGRDQKRVEYRFHCGAVPFNTGQSGRDEVVYAQRAVRGEISYDVFAEPIREFKRLATEHDFLPVLSYIPAAAIAYAPAVFRDPDIGAVLEQFNRDQRQYMEQLARETDLLFMDLTPTLQERARAEPPTLDNLLYFPGNIHLTPRGHAVVAEELARRLRPWMEAGSRAGDGSAAGAQR